MFRFSGFREKFLSWISLLAICFIHFTFPSAENREMFESVERLCLPHLHPAYSLFYTCTNAGCNVNDFHVFKSLHYLKHGATKKGL